MTAALRGGGFFAVNGGDRSVVGVAAVSLPGLAVARIGLSDSRYFGRSRPRRSVETIDAMSAMPPIAAAAKRIMAIAG